MSSNRSPLCYWLLRQRGQTVRQATRALEGVSVAAKNELLFQHGINFNDLPAWQKRGVGVFWETYEKIGLNPKTGEQTTAVRRRLATDFTLPIKEAYSTFLAGVVQAAQAA